MIPNSQNPIKLSVHASHKCKSSQKNPYFAKKRRNVEENLQRLTAFVKSPNSVFLFPFIKKNTFCSVIYI